ncbi:hypothetical protein [Marinicella rhabdoformis]|uniref:hypothetical protein n=1 Tax=Marinicella rhabdoformis TaxID=2580566 RepID=UPI0012AEB289|nr:hypothetical protein [Marinicella rhabdoformis]
MTNRSRNIIALVVGISIGMAVNMGIIMSSGMLIPPPEGVDVMDAASIKANLHLFEPKHFIMPFLAHALGTLVGALVAVMMSVNNHKKLALYVGLFFLAGGVAASAMIPAPVWFIALDLVVAYLPMAWLASKIKK